MSPTLCHLARRAPLSSLMFTPPRPQHLIGWCAVVSSTVVLAATAVTAPSARHVPTRGHLGWLGRLCGPHARPVADVMDMQESAVYGHVDR
jgi:hypothetical protein